MSNVLSDDYIGVVWAWFGSATSLPPGWLMCDGTAIPAQYVLLINRVGTNLPDLGGRVVIGAGTPLSPTNSDGSNPNWEVNGPANPTFTLGTLLGEFSHYLATPEMPAHSHNISMSDNDQGGPGNGPTLMTEGGYWQTDIQGDGLAHNNAQPAVVLNYIIYAGQQTT